MRHVCKMPKTLRESRSGQDEEESTQPLYRIKGKLVTLLCARRKHEMARRARLRLGLLRRERTWDSVVGSLAVFLAISAARRTFFPLSVPPINQIRTHTNCARSPFLSPGFRHSAPLDGRQAGRASTAQHTFPHWQYPMATATRQTPKERRVFGYWYFELKYIK